MSGESLGMSRNVAWVKAIYLWLGHMDVVDHINPESNLAKSRSSGNDYQLYNYMPLLLSRTSIGAPFGAVLYLFITFFSAKEVRSRRRW